jgi:competence protein ComEC
VTRLSDRPAQAIVLAACIGLAFANALRIGILALVFALVALAATRFAEHCLLTVALAVSCAGWWWGSARLAALDRSPLAARIGTAERLRAVVTATPRRGRFDIRVEGTVVRYGMVRPDEHVLLRLRPGRAPPQGAIIDALGEVAAPRRARNGFDERRWLRRHGMHVVIHVDTWAQIGRRGGIGGISDRLRVWLGRSVARGLHGERAALLEGIVLGDEAGLSDNLRMRFRASGLYHLLAVSGQNVALVAAGALALVWLLGLSRGIGQAAALLSITAYVLAVGPQPSVIRAGIAGALGSLAWLTARMADRWQFLLLGAVALLAWNPYTLFDAGFQLSFAAVAAIFALVPRFQRALEGYPMPRWTRDAVAVSAACGLATGPIMWIQFHAVSLVAIPANALAAPAMVPLLALAFASAAIAPVVPAGASILAWLNGWLAAYIATCARVVGSLPGAQIQSTRALLLVLAGVLLAAAYAWPKWRPSSSPFI